MKKIIYSIEIIILVAILYLRYYDPATSEKIEASQILYSICGYIIFFILVDQSAGIIKYFHSKRRKRNFRKKDNFHFGIDNISRLLIIIGFIVTCFGFFGIDFKSLLTSMSIVAAAIAIISKEFINDFLVGLYFSFTEDFEISDYVKFGEQKGKIIEIGMFKIKVLNDDDDLVIVPNGKIFNGEIINYTKRDIRLMSIDFQVDVRSIKNVERLEKELITSLVSFFEFIEPESYNLKIVEMKKDYLDLKFQYTLKQLDREMQRNIRRKTVREVFNFISSRDPDRNDTEEIQLKHPLD